MKLTIILWICLIFVLKQVNSSVASMLFLLVIIGLIIALISKRAALRQEAQKICSTNSLRETFTQLVKADSTYKAIKYNLIPLTILFILSLWLSSSKVQEGLEKGRIAAMQADEKRIKCAFVKSENGEKLSVGLNCPTGDCVERKCSYVTGGTYACSGVCE